MSIPKTTTVYTCRDATEVPWIKSTLKAEGIEVFVVPLTDSAFDGIYTPQRGTAQIQVYEKDVLAAERIIKDLKGAQ
jgi:hypothetical protein